MTPPSGCSPPNMWPTSWRATRRAYTVSLTGPPGFAAQSRMGPVLLQNVRLNTLSRPMVRGPMNHACPQCWTLVPPAGSGGSVAWGRDSHPLPLRSRTSGLHRRSLRRERPSASLCPHSPLPGLGRPLCKEGPTLPVRGGQHFARAAATQGGCTWQPCRAVRRAREGGRRYGVGSAWRSVWVAGWSGPYLPLPSSRHQSFHFAISSPPRSSKLSTPAVDSWPVRPTVSARPIMAW
jgi:hypothetical protein